MSHTTRSIFDANPATFDATQEVVSIGDLVVDPAGLNPPGIVTGPNSARSVQPLGGIPLPLSDVALSSTQPGASGTCLVKVEVTDPGPGTPLKDAVVLLSVTSASVLVGGQISGEGTLLASVLDQNNQRSLILTAKTGITGKAEVQLTGTAGIGFNISAAVIFPLPSTKDDTGSFKP